MVIEWALAYAAEHRVGGGETVRVSVGPLVVRRPIALPVCIWPRHMTLPLLGLGLPRWDVVWARRDAHFGLMRVSVVALVPAVADPHSLGVISVRGESEPIEAFLPVVGAG